VTQTARYRRLRRAGRAFVVGLVAGDVLVDTVGWRGVFFVNVPVCVVLRVARALPADKPSGRGRDLDLTGALLVTAGMAVLVYAPTVGTSHGWD
jgi:predicted MFS family arabinose efflux permease